MKSYEHKLYIKIVDFNVIYISLGDNFLFNII
jgi:hypothetical protein